MNDVIFMHVLDALANLSHKEHAVPFGQSKVVCHDSFEKLATGNAVGWRRYNEKTKKKKRKRTVGTEEKS